MRFGSGSDVRYGSEYAAGTSQNGCGLWNPKNAANGAPLGSAATARSSGAAASASQKSVQFPGARLHVSGSSSRPSGSVVEHVEICASTSTNSNAHEDEDEDEDEDDDDADGGAPHVATGDEAVQRPLPGSLATHSVTFTGAALAKPLDHEGHS